MPTKKEKVIAAVEVYFNAEDVVSSKETAAVDASLALATAQSEKATADTNLSNAVAIASEAKSSVIALLNEDEEAEEPSEFELIEDDYDSPIPW